MKILLMGFSKIKYMPYLHLYLENIDCEKNDVHVLYWNRDLKDESLDEYSMVSLHEFFRYQQDNVRVLSKIPNFLRYRSMAKKLIHKHNYDFIIVLHTFPGVLLADLLMQKYKGNYIFDYRDSTYEKFTLFRKIIHKLVQESHATFISSEGFRSLLPETEKEKIHTSHNLSYASLKHRDDKTMYGINSKKIRISYWGFIRDERINRIMIKRFANDLRFELHYYGREDTLTERIKMFANEMNASNIFFHGEFSPIDRYRFIVTTDIIHNVFCNKNMMIAMSNRFYDGLVFRIPQLCMQESHMGNVVEKTGVGFSGNPEDESYADEVYNYFLSINREKFSVACDTELEKVILEYQHSCHIIQQAMHKDK